MDNNEFEFYRPHLGRVRKDPTMTFIGGLVIGLAVGGMIGAALMGHHVLSVLNLI